MDVAAAPESRRLSLDLDVVPDLARSPAPSARTQVVDPSAVDALLDDAKRRIATEEGLSFRPINMPFQKPVERDFTAADRPHTTLLFGGFNYRHEHLIQAVFQSLGYHCDVLPSPNTSAFQAGKEYGNNGQCNPTYFTVGNLVQYLQHLCKEHGLTKQEVVDRYVFLTAGACGPCRFGMYEAEYRLALRNAGFEGFRVLLFQQKGGLKQSDVEAGLRMDADFFMGLVTAINMGDLLNEVANQIRPYEVVAGETDRVLYEALDYLAAAIKSHVPARLSGRLAALVKERKKSAFDGAEFALKFLDLMTTEDYTAPLREVARRFDAIAVDRLQPKPVVKITGEFWAQTTEGDGNFNMFRFLQGEGAEIITEPIANWLAYMLWQTKIRTKDRKNLAEAQAPAKWYEFSKRLESEVAYYKKRGVIAFADQVYRREYDRCREALGGTAFAVVDMFEMERIAHDFYHSRSEGGEGHLEVAKNIYYTMKGYAHMVLSLKPFGCMPSTQSDGAQSAVTNRFKDMIYLPIETSGEGEINAHSRVQMALGEAKAKAKREYAEVLGAVGFSEGQLRAYVAENPELSRPLYKIPRKKGAVSMAARFVSHVADRMRAEGLTPETARSAGSSLDASKSATVAA